MTIANCPRCCEQVSIPDNATEEATVQCPLCQEEYSLGEALSQLPPTLIVLSDIGATSTPITTDEDDSSWEELNLDENDADEIALAPMGAAAPAAAFDFTSGSTTAGGKTTSTIRPSSRSRKPKGSPIKSVLSIVIGGMMAFPIAQLILWYLPGDLKRDFGAGPIVAQYVPAIVPAKFRGSKANSDSNTEPSFGNANVAGSDFNFGDTDKFAAPANNGNQNASKPPASKNKKKPKADLLVTEEPVTEEVMSIEDAAAAGADVFGSAVDVPGLELGGLPTFDEPEPPATLPNAITKATDEPALELPPLVDPPMNLETPAAEVTGLATGNIRNAPQVTADTVVNRFQAALTGNLAWDTDEASTPSRTLMREFYESFSKLGEALTFAEQTDEQVATQIEETSKLLQEIGKQPDKLGVISLAAKGWMAAGYDTRKTNGVCLYGVIKAVEPIGELFETTLDSGGQEVAVVSKSNPAEHFAVDRHVLILGTILEDPTKNLGGYEGSRKSVVLDGFHVNVAAE